MSTQDSSSVATTTSFSSFIQQLKPRLTTPQFFWYLGHVSTVSSTALYFVSSFFSYNYSKKFYNYALLSIISTYLIVLFQIFKSSKLNLLNPKHLINNDNFQYLSLAITWYLLSNYKLISGGLYPFLIFSIFHSLNYSKNYILPIFPSISSTVKTSLSDKINHLITQYNEQSLVAASNLEILTLFQLLISLPLTLFQIIRNFKLAFVNIVILIQYITFIKLRYRQSKHTKALIDSYVYRADVIVQSGRLPAALTNIYVQLKGKVIQILRLIPF